MGIVSSLQTAALALLAMMATGGSAFGALDAHYLGTSRDGGEFRIYLHGGAYVGRSGSVQTVRVTVHALRKGRRLQALEGCVYHFDDKDRGRDRIECAETAPGPLRGVAYARAHGQAAGAADAAAPMVCVQRCTIQAPQRLLLEEADEDNG
ncbi:hypothetical protein RD110_23250 [Rhodoferax koreense]|uniref:Uncharacterized protein n=1 Tax=Rhodoferax koreensis TaxID=1842727 RepID=A0A1P8K185_9BURK|nr:hypothetical protein [Rhodoferax koreense]APW39756.1 hypothetical protein RD110_23250 [Rhodoferax koreense]